MYRKSHLFLTPLHQISFFIGISYCLGDGYDSISEDKLLEQTQRAMSDTNDWSVGCKTTRSNA